MPGEHYCLLRCVSPCPLWVKSRHVQCTRRCLLCANSGHRTAHSITSSASNCIELGTSMPSALAVCRLMTNSLSARGFSCPSTVPCLKAFRAFVKVHGNPNRSEGPEGVNKERDPDDADLQSIEIFGPTDRPL